MPRTMTAAPPERARFALPRSGRFLFWGGMAVLALLLVQAARETQVSPANLLSGAGRIVDIVRRACPPDWHQLPMEWKPAQETFNIALVGTALGALLACPLALLSSRTIVRHAPVRMAARCVVGLLRAVPDLVWALIFVTAVGLGPFPGVLSLTLHTAGMLGRLGAEMIEDMDVMPMEAMELAGANRLQIFAHGVVPMLAPSMFGLVLYRFDENLRSSLVLGFVGAGGLGFQLYTAISLFQYRTASLLLLMTLVMVIAVEGLSSVIRRHLS
ncbi:phosphonate ABC transporter, permease protein PhnE [Gluconacetobacter sp.]|uniref:phosphonate ABC transporter, permease protein PhnE n=1 Tax=Gluconacetobacter sp. TaxID=1935994 RepID=UPI0039E99B42